jgi:hypothetical protein
MAKQPYPNWLIFFLASSYAVTGVAVAEFALLAAWLFSQHPGGLRDVARAAFAAALAVYALWRISMFAIPAGPPFRGFRYPFGLHLARPIMLLETGLVGLLCGKRGYRYPGLVLACWGFLATARLLWTHVYLLKKGGKLGRKPPAPWRPR